MVQTLGRTAFKFYGATAVRSEVSGGGTRRAVLERTIAFSRCAQGHCGIRLVAANLETKGMLFMDRKTPEKSLSALLVGEYEGDRFLIHKVFRRVGWRLFEARDRERAMKCLERNPVQVVIAESNLPNWNWKRVLNDLRRLAKPPQLIVTSRTADESLWAEVLNIGGYDVMAQPLQEYEVERVIASAHRQFIHQPLRAATHTA